MRNRIDNSYILKGAFKRVGITILCCIPILILLGYFLQFLNDAVLIFIFVAVMLIAICIVEYFHRKRQQRKEVLKTLHKNEDVFK